MRRIRYFTARVSARAEDPRLPDRQAAYLLALATLPEVSIHLGEFKVKRSAKPQAVYDRLLAHSLPPGGCWIDPFPATHIEEYPGPGGSVVLAPSLWNDISITGTRSDP